MTSFRAITLIFTLGVGLIAASGSLREPRAQARGPGSSATLLPDGRWLVVGGLAGKRVTRGAALYDPRSGETTMLPAKLCRARAWHATTILPDGGVLIAGGIGQSGHLVRRAERFDPATGAFSLIAASMTPRAGHTATVLTDGRVLLVGGRGPAGELLATAELWDPGGATSVTVGSLAVGRTDHTATLLSDGRVLIWGGTDSNGAVLQSGEIFSPSTLGFEETAAPPMEPGEPARVVATIPPDGAEDVSLDARLAIRFSPPVTVSTVNADTVGITGPRGAVSVRVVPAEAGRLAFVTPTEPLDPGARYVLVVLGISEDAGDLPRAEVRFSTGGQPERVGIGGFDEGAVETANKQTTESTAIPSAAARKQHRRRRRWQDLPSLQAPDGETALTGQVLRVNGQPIPGVVLKIDDHMTKSDRTGRFLLTGLTCGHCVLVIDGHPASRDGRTYGVFEFGEDIESGRTNVLSGTIWMPLIDVAHAVEIPSPTTDEVVIRTPRIPGLELHLPPHTVIRDRDGNVVRRVSITPFDKTRPIMARPDGFEFPVFFTIQPGGAHVEAPGGGGGWLVYPNPTRLQARRQVPFYSYDPRGKDWFIYGTGTVSRDGRRIVADPGTAITEFHCKLVDPNPEPPPGGCNDDPNPVCSPTDHGPDSGPGPGPGAPTSVGNPVDPSTGIFIHKHTDLFINDVIPIALTREYESQDKDARQLGIGMTFSYAMHLFSPHEFTEMDLVKPDRSVVHYDRTSGGDGYRDAIFEHTGSPTKQFFKSRITWNGNGWNLRLHNGDLYVFGQNGTLGSIRNRIGNRVAIARDSSNGGRIKRVTSPSGRFIDFFYKPDSKHYLSRVTDNIGRTVSYTYAGDTLTTVTYADSSTTTYTWKRVVPTSFLRISDIKNQRGFTYLTNDYYPTTGRVKTQTLASAIDPSGKCPDLSAQQSHGGYAFAYTMNNGHVATTLVTDPRSFQRQITFDPGGYALSDTRALGTADQQVMTYTRYPGTHLVQTVTDPLGRVTRFSYDPNGNPAAITRMDGTAGAATTTYTYESDNKVHTITDPLLHVTTLDHDLVGRLSQATDPDGHAITYHYDSPLGQVSAVLNVIGDITQYLYRLGDLASVQDPAGSIVEYAYDPVGRLKTSTNPLGYVTSYTYDDMDRLRTQTDARGNVTTYDYDANGNLCTSTDVRHHTTTFRYDNLDRATFRSDPLGRQSTVRYDDGGNVILTTDADGISTFFGYDGIGRTRSVYYRADTTFSPPHTAESSQSFAYDGANRLIAVADNAFGILGRTYDDIRRISTEATCPIGGGFVCPGRTISYQYDSAGRRSSMTVPGQAVTTYDYYPSSKILDIVRGGESVLVNNDGLGRRAGITLTNGTGTLYTYDQVSRVKTLTYTSAGIGGLILGDLAYDYDPAGRPSAVKGSWARINVPTNVTTTPYDPANQLTSWNGTAIGYDARGNVHTDGASTYAWNGRGQLAFIVGPGRIVIFYYDALGRRWQRNDNGVLTRYLYDGITPVQETDGNGNITANLLTGMGTDEYFSRTAAGNTRYFLSDALHSTVALTNESGGVVTEYAYEPYGRVSVNHVLGTSDTPYQYAGRENDGTGLYYYRARYYHPGFGRFLSADPSIPLDLPSAENAYTYAGDMPTTLIDPLGLDAHDPTEHGGAERELLAIAGYIWSSPNSVLGLLLGLPGLLEGNVNADHNAIEITEPWGSGAVTLGNVTIYGSDTGPLTDEHGYGDEGMHTVGEHEEAHTYQADTLGPAFIPAYLVGAIMGEIAGHGTSDPLHDRANFMEVGPGSTPPRPWR